MAVVSIGRNIASLRAQRQLAQSSAALSSTFERLSSGLRINRAADDAAGISISSKLKNHAGVFAQAIRNANDGISALNIADGTVRQLSSILIRLKELAEQSGNGTMGLTQRRSIDREGEALVNEYNRLLSTSKFNKRNVLDGSMNNLGIQLGYGTNGQVTFSLGGELDRTVGTSAFNDSGADDWFGSAVNGEVEIGDLNQDGRSDLASVYNNSVNVGISVGSGVSPGGGPNVAFAATITGLELADVNGDGHLDMLASYSSGLGVALGNGNGTFQSAVNYSGGSGGGDVTTADFNGDGFQDMVTVRSSGIDVYLNNGNGTFANRVNYAAGSGVSDVAVGDINGDGRVDIVTSSATDGRANVLSGSGSGTFGPAVSYAAGTGANQIVLGDFNHDGVLDIATTSTDSNVNILNGNSNGTFQTKRSYSTGASPGQLNLVDRNGDGHPDLLLTSGGYVSYFQGNGDGTLQSRVDENPGAAELGISSIGSYGFGVGDMDGDGVLDIAYNDGAAMQGQAYGQTTQSYTLQRFDLNSRTEALNAITNLNHALLRVNKETAQIGAAQSRLQTTLNTLAQIRDNYLAANSRITDIDVAAESAKLVNNQIRQEVAYAVLAQANLVPQLAVRLLQ